MTVPSTDHRFLACGGGRAGRGREEEGEKERVWKTKSEFYTLKVPNGGRADTNRLFVQY